MTVLMLFLLLVAAPIMDTAFITLSLSRTTDLSFSEAGFGSIQYGLHQNFEVLDTVQIMTSCKLVRFASRKDDFLDAKFLLCHTPLTKLPEAENLTGFIVEVNSESQIRILVFVRGNGTVGANFAELQTKEGNFRVKAGMTSESVKPLTSMALELLRKECGEISEIRSLSSGDTVVASAQVRCARDSTTDRRNSQLLRPESTIAEALREKLTFVPSNKLLVVSREPQLDIRDASEFHFLHRRERNASTFMLVVLTLSILLVRVLVGFFLSNDVADCLDYVVKDRLGFKRCDSLFWAGQERISYRKKFQEGEIAQYGLHREDLREVEKFTGGIVGGYEHSYNKT